MDEQITILIPTDFRVASLHTLRLALELIQEPVVNVVLLHCRTLDDSITDLLFYSPRRIVDDLLTNDFRDAISLISNRFEHKMGKLRIELFHGHAQSTFNVLLETLQIDAIYVPKSYSLHVAKRAFDPLPYIVKCTIPYYRLPWDWQYITEEDRLENLFL